MTSHFGQNGVAHWRFIQKVAKYKGYSESKAQFIIKLESSEII